MTTRQPYQGEYRKLLLAFDVGTTYSGISYSVLDPGEVPVVRGVTRFPAQDHVGGNSKIPSIIYYDKKGDVRAVGAETLQENVILDAEEEGWDKVEWFKLHLRPKTMTSGRQEIPPLPKNKTVVRVLADFLEYLLNCARDFIKDTHGTGVMLWDSVQGRIEFILSHPNGWEGSQQNQIRRAAVLAALVPDTPDGQSKIHLVTEGEASLHFCIGNGLAKDAIKMGQGFIIVDAGGGTIDLSAYSMKSLPNSFEEIAESACYFQGSVFVSRRARELLQEKLRGSLFDDIDDIVNRFDKSTKLTFKNDESEFSYVQVGTRRDNDPSVGVRFGRLKLRREEVTGLFEPSIQAIVQGIVEQRRIAPQPITTIFLVGGFAASDWVFSRLQLYLEPLGMKFSRPDSHMNKAVADGAISYHIDHYVSVRVARFTYGARCGLHYDKTNLRHLVRSHNVYTTLSGQQLVQGYFDVILPKGTQVSESNEFRRSYWREVAHPAGWEHLTEEIECYRGVSMAPTWIDSEPDMFSALCTVNADVSGMTKNLTPRRGLTDNQYYTLQYDIVLCFGLTELKAQVAWKENGQEKRSPATIMYDSD